MFLDLRGVMARARRALRLQQEAAIQINEWNLRQLSIVHDEIHNLAQQQAALQTLQSFDPPLDASFFRDLRGNQLSQLNLKWLPKRTIAIKVPIDAVSINQMIKKLLRLPLINGPWLAW
jgi:hypothetical protein